MTKLIKPKNHTNYLVSKLNPCPSTIVAIYSGSTTQKTRTTANLEAKQARIVK